MASVDISEYLITISSGEDKKLFEEAVMAAQVGALRASYIMIWISCAESIKRRFNEAQIRDGQARRIAGEVVRREGNHQSVDKYLLDEALKYGFINATEHSQLFAIYQNRCLFGHPYETQPLAEQLQSAAAEVVTFILSKPIKLRHGYMDSIIQNFIRVPNYIDDTEEAISAFADEVLNKFDNGLYGWFIDKFAKELIQIENDANLNAIRFRAYNFIKAFLKKVDLSFFSPTEWHDFVMKYEKLSLNVCLNSELFNKIGRESSDYLVGAILSNSLREPRILSYLNDHFVNGILTDRHIERIMLHFDVFNSDLAKKARFLRDSGIEIRIVFDIVIDLLKSCDWYTQNPIVEYIMNLSLAEMNLLNASKLEILGRNILQCAIGGAKDAQSWLGILETTDMDYPEAFLKGMLLECFIREDQNIRNKIHKLDQLHIIFEAMQTEKRERIINDVIEVMQNGKLDSWYNDIFSRISDRKAAEFPLFSDIIIAFNSFESGVTNRN